MSLARLAPFVVLPALGVIPVLAASCSTPSPDARFVANVPDEATFAAVQPVLMRKCGTLDCHGNIHRNLRIFGSETLRWSPNDRPLVPRQTTPDELAQDFESVVGLEPEVLSAVVASGTAPERLTLVRKARGTEAHKAGAPIHEGDDSDVCITSWLTGHVDTGACSRGAPPLK